MRNTLGDLNNHLFSCLERLNDEEITDEALTKEINRSKAVATISQQIISNGKLVLKARAHAAESVHNPNAIMPRILEA